MQDNRVAAVTHQKSVIDESHAREKKRQHRQFEHHAEGEHQARDQRKIVADLQQRLHVDRFVAVQQKTQPPANHDCITEHHAANEEKRAEEDEAPSVALFMLVKPRRDKLPSLPQQNRRGDE